MKLSALLLAAALVLPFAASAQEFTPYNALPAGVYKSDPTHTSLNWKVSHAGLSNYTARFTKVDSTVTLDPKDVTKSSVVATIDPNSIQTDYPNAKEKDFNKELSTGATWFNSAKFPAITFKSTKIEKTGDKTAKIHGDLTLLGVTKPVVLDATLNGGYAEQPFSKKPTIGISASTKIKRSEWGLSTYVPMIGDEVQVFIESELAQDGAVPAAAAKK